ncbi:MAG: phenylacetate--CoA ligase family protein [Bacteroidales bacterium]|nr:phenylacetate--CoA ligase family protein [Bacteroidales bacterium]
MGGIFKKSYQEAKDREFYSYDQWELYQTNELRKVLLHAYDTVPLYKEKYDKEGITRKFLSRIKLKELQLLPFLTKDELRKFGKTKLLSNKKGKGIYFPSSGSTGTPTALYYGKEFHQKSYGIFEARVRNWAGVDHKMARGMIGGRTILPNSELKSPYYRYNIFEKQTYFSAYHLTPNTASNFIEGMIKHKVEYLTGYAMSNFFLAEFIEKQQLVAPEMKAVLTSSEKMTLEMRKVIERVYKCKVFDAYSGSESCGLISESPLGELLVSPDVGIMEFLREDNSYAANGEAGEIVSTGFLNYDQPLIRYRIGDRAKLAGSQKNKSGHCMIKVEEIIGRIQDVIVSRDGKRLARFYGLYSDIQGIMFAQIVQHDFENFSINIVCDDSYNKEQSERLIKSRLNSQIGKSEVKFNYLEALPVDKKNGKIKAVISNLNQCRSSN